MGKWTDKNYITHSEWTNDFGGARRKRTLASEDFRQLPFDHCSLTLLPFAKPVATVDGHVFDEGAIRRYVEECGKDPVDGKDLAFDDLIPLQFFRNASGEMHCPVTLKAFNAHSHIVAVRSSGRVYSRDGLARLAFRDYVTDEPICEDDLISLQDPRDIQRRNWAHFREHLVDDSATQQASSTVNMAGSAGRMVGRVQREGTAAPSIPRLPEQPEEQKTRIRATHSTGRVAASLTSTAMTPVTVNEYALMSKYDLLFSEIRSLPTPPACHATIRTDRGDLHFELYATKAPRCVYNFLRLARSGYYAGTRFHRLVAGFIAQGGDPTGTGRGGESVYGRPFGEPMHAGLSHNARGVLSMANLGRPCTNTSQFFIAFAPCPHLDHTHPVFGRMLNGWAVLDAIEAAALEDSTATRSDVIIEDVIVIDDPFDGAEKRQAEREAAARQGASTPTPASTSPSTTTVGKYIRKK